MGLRSDDGHFTARGSFRGGPSAVFPRPRRGSPSIVRSAGGRDQDEEEDEGVEDDEAEDEGGDAEERDEQGGGQRRSGEGGVV